MSRGLADCAGLAIDGAMRTIHPYRLAIGSGCTHVLSLSGRRAGPVAGRYAPAEVAVTAALAPDRRLAGARRRAARQYRHDLAVLAAASARVGLGRTSLAAEWLATIPEPEPVPDPEDRPVDDPVSPGMPVPVDAIAAD